MRDIYVDADACPVKEETIRVATRHDLNVYMVSNAWLRQAVGPKVHRIVVDGGFDAADNWIADHAGPGDIAITADIQLAARCLAKGAKVVGPTGRPFTNDNIGMSLAMRELTAQLRDMGEIKGYNAAFSKQDRSRFLSTLESLIQAMRREFPVK